jgi:hypothetical protein
VGYRASNSCPAINPLQCPTAFHRFSTTYPSMFPSCSCFFVLFGGTDDREKHLGFWGFLRLMFVLGSPLVRERS